MTHTKFFNNKDGNTLFAKLRGIAGAMPNFDAFLAVVGFFRSTGYFKLRSELDGVDTIKILVGINVDKLFYQHKQGLLHLLTSAQVKDEFHKEFVQDVQEAGYTEEVEMGIRQMCEDLQTGRLEMRIHPTKQLHAKFYLCLPKEHNPYTDGWVIMGSSNISCSGLGLSTLPQYELNVALKDYDEVHYCHEQFAELWEEGVPLSIQDIEQSRQTTYLGYQPTPYELYIKVLIEFFGEQVEERFSIQLPPSFKPLKYQQDAVVQGYQLLLQHHGFFLSDVVGLGKTVIATMIASRFVEANGKRTNILVVHPPALESNWRETFGEFGLLKHAQFVSTGSLDKVITMADQYRGMQDFDLVIVDEAHGFRNDTTTKYDALQRICKAPCAHSGLLGGVRKCVMLLSATPLNNTPDDLYHQLLLFQDEQDCTIDGIPSLKQFFAPLLKKYKKLMSQGKKFSVASGENESLEVKQSREAELNEIINQVDLLYEEIRTKVLDKVTIRRTRNNILNDPDYRADIQAQGIVFPVIAPPQELIYQMDEDTSSRFYKTLGLLTSQVAQGDVEGLCYARYRAIEFLCREKKNKYPNAEHIAHSLAQIYTHLMVKRLESSFYAFKQSLQGLRDATAGMLSMFEQGQVVIAPELKIKELQAKGMELDEILDLASHKGYNVEDIVFSSEDFQEDFPKMLRHDLDLLNNLIADWDKEQDDPKFDKLKEQILHQLFDKERNPSGKLVIFSESADTLEYLYRRITSELGREDVLKVTSHNRKKYETTIRENFDANYAGVMKDRYNIIVTTDVLAEGVNLHRANVIVNYDSPWNATRLMQRIGRVNRIGSPAGYIYNYLFYPSQQGDGVIQLYKNALIKLQSFHSAFGEDAQVYSREEILKTFTLFDSTVQDSIDRKLALQREVRELYATNPKLYHKIKSLPLKSRCLRRGDETTKASSVIFVASSFKKEFYRVDDHELKPIDFLEAVDLLQATPDEQMLSCSNPAMHYEHVNDALESYEQAHCQEFDTSAVVQAKGDPNTTSAKRFLREVMMVYGKGNGLFAEHCRILLYYVDKGTYSQLVRALNKLQKSRPSTTEGLAKEIAELYHTYHSELSTGATAGEDTKPLYTAPHVVIAETFL